MSIYRNSILHGHVAGQLTQHEHIVHVVRAVRALALPERRAFLADLDGGTETEKYIAAVAALAVRDVQWIKTHLAEAVEHIQRMTLRCTTPELIPDETIEVAVLGDISHLARKALLRSATAHRPALAQQLFPQVRCNWGDAMAVLLLPHCPAPFVSQYLSEMLPVVRNGFHWRRLSRTHPHILLDALIQDHQLLTGKGMPSSTWWELNGQGVEVLVNQTRSKELIGKVFDLLDAGSKDDASTFPSSLMDCTSALARAEPARLLRYVGGGGMLRISDLSKQATKRMVRKALGTDELVAAARRIYSPLSDLLPHIPPRARGQLWCAVEPPTYDDEDAAYQLDSYQAVLPIAECVAVARRALRESDLEPDQKLWCYGFLPCRDKKAQRAIAKAMRKPDPDLRSLGYVQRAFQARRSGDAALWATALEDLARRMRNEIVTVRARAMHGITQGPFPPSIWSLAALPPIKAIIVDSQQAPDRAPRLRFDFMDFVAYIVSQLIKNPQAVQWGKEMFDLLGESSSISFRSFPPGSDEAVWSIARSRVIASAKKHRYSLLIKLVQELPAPRLAKLPELEELVFHAVHHSKETDLSQAATSGSSRGPEARSEVEQLLKVYLQPKATRTARLTQLLEEDASIVTFTWVADLAAFTQPVERVLQWATSPPVGRFLDEDEAAAWVLPCSPHALRAVSESALGPFRARIADVIQSEDSVSRRDELFKLLATIPGGQRAISARIGQGVDGYRDVSTFEQALKALASPPYLHVLLSYASTDHARSAMPSAGHAVDRASPSAFKRPVLRVLRAPKSKVTSRKLAVRIVAQRLPLSESIAILREEAVKPGIHRDVLAAIAACVRQYLLGVEAAWAVLDRVFAPLPEEEQARAGAELDDEAQTRVEDRQSVRMQILEASPFAVAPQVAGRYGGLVAGLASSEDKSVAHEALAALASWAVFYPEAYRVLEQTATDPTRPLRLVRVAAVHSIVELSHTPEGERTLCSTVSTLLATKDTPEHVLGEQYDCPSRQLVERLIDQLQQKIGCFRDVDEDCKPAAWACVKAMHRVPVRPAVDMYTLLAHLIDLKRLFTHPAVPQVVPRTLEDLMKEGPDRLPEATLIITALGFILSDSPGALHSVLSVLDMGQHDFDFSQAWSTDEGVGFFAWLSRLSTSHALWAATIMRYVAQQQDHTTPAWKDVIRTLRAHPSDDVSALACVIDAGQVDY